MTINCLTLKNTPTKPPGPKEIQTPTAVWDYNQCGDGGRPAAKWFQNGSTPTK